MLLTKPADTTIDLRGDQNQRSTLQYFHYEFRYWFPLLELLESRPVSSRDDEALHQCHSVAFVQHTEHSLRRLGKDQCPEIRTCGSSHGLACHVQFRLIHMESLRALRYEPPSSGAQARLFQQNTIARAASIEGIGIHSGQRTTLRLLPAPTGTGVVFRRVDSGVEIPAKVSSVCSLELATTIGRDDVTVSTIEHLMAAVHMARIDNLVVEIDGPEVPILDGSALPYCRLIEAAGVRRQRDSRDIMVVTKPLHLDLGEGRSATIKPYPGLSVRYKIDYELPSIGEQNVFAEVNGQSFVKDLASARTFARLVDVEMLRKNGLGLGGQQHNCVVFDETGPINTELRFANEPVRHKAMDAIGDLALLGRPIWGQIEIQRGGHWVHFKLAEALLQNQECWTLVSGDLGDAIESTALSAFGPPENADTLADTVYV